MGYDSAAFSPNGNLVSFDLVIDVHGLAYHFKDIWQFFVVDEFGIKAAFFQFGVLEVYADVVVAADDLGGLLEGYIV
jgi:hypothetical protein